MEISTLSLVINFIVLLFILPLLFGTVLSIYVNTYKWQCLYWFLNHIHWVSSAHVGLVGWLYGLAVPFELLQMVNMIYYYGQSGLLQHSATPRHCFFFLPILKPSVFFLCFFLQWVDKRQMLTTFASILILHDLVLLEKKSFFTPLFLRTKTVLICSQTYWCFSVQNLIQNQLREGGQGLFFFFLSASYMVLLVFCP